MPVFPPNPSPERARGGHVFYFLRTDCPVGNRYTLEIAAIARAHPAPAFTHTVVYPVAAEDDAEVLRHREDYGLGHLRILRDPRAALVRATGITVTPEVAVFTTGGKLAYRGRIDDRFSAPGVGRPEPARRDLREMLTSLGAGRPPGRPASPVTTRAIGCYLE